MIRAAGLALFSALLGGAIALFAQRRPAVLERTRTFAFAAAAAVVAFHLLPEALPAQGLAALVWMGLGFALPWALEAGARALGPGLLEGRGLTSARVAAEVGFAALIFHSVAEGLALVAALAQPGTNLDLEIALVAHHAPLTAAVVLPFLDLRGARAAGLRAGLIGAAGVAGVLASGLFPRFREGAVLEVATAATAGALLHVVADEIRAQRFASGWERAADVAACAAGLLVAGLGALLHLRHAPADGPLPDFLRAVTGLAIASAPALLAGAVTSALLGARGRFFRWDALLLALALFGWAPAMALGTLFLLLSLPSARLFARPAGTSPVLPGLVASVRRRAPPLLTLLFLAAGIEVSAPALPRSSPVVFALSAALLLATRLDEAGAVIVAAALLHKGLDPGLALALLALGPVSRRAALRQFGSWRPALLLAGSAAVALSAGSALSRWGALSLAQPAVAGALSAVHESLPVQALASPLGAAAALVLLAIALATLWTEGVRGWFSPLRHGPKAA